MGRRGLWVGQHRRNRKIHQVDPQTGVIIRTIDSNRFVTGVTWVEGELWHGTWEAEKKRTAPNQSRERRGSGADLPRLATFSGTGWLARYGAVQAISGWTTLTGEIQ